MKGAQSEFDREQPLSREEMLERMRVLTLAESLADSSANANLRDEALKQLTRRVEEPFAQDAIRKAFLGKDLTSLRPAELVLQPKDEGDTRWLKAQLEEDPELLAKDLGLELVERLKQRLSRPLEFPQNGFADSAKKTAEKLEELGDLLRKTCEIIDQTRIKYAQARESLEIARGGFLIAELLASSDGNVHIPSKEDELIGAFDRDDMVAASLQAQELASEAVRFAKELQRNIPESDTMLPEPDCRSIDPLKDYPRAKSRLFTRALEIMRSR